ncbi:RDD family protein [Evansella halocellulosilytica]|uniref:RDD family protein n=1 Tax=Evansella halocellulosilytica TaxID=2011013 RepID=UPI000BB6BE66|nr:RDD family protein [Evansella halocellulosilytica]
MTYDNESLEGTNHQVVEEGQHYTLAGFWMRFWAYIVDLLIVASINGIVLSPILTFTNLNELNWGTILSFGGIMTAIVSFGYFTIMTKLYRQTVGKMIFGVKVLSQKEELTWLDVIFREVIGRYIHQSLFFMNLLYLIVAFHPLKKGLHDYFADTVVILEPRKKKTIKTEY